MILQRDINAFFTVLDVLANPEKAKAELKLLAEQRASVDAEVAKLGEAAQKAQGMMKEAQAILATQAEMNRKYVSQGAALEARENGVKDREAEVVKIAHQNQEINKLLNAREVELAAREKDFTQRVSRYETSLADHNVRMEALRKKETEYREKMEKLRAISN